MIQNPAIQNAGSFNIINDSKNDFIVQEMAMPGEIVSGDLMIRGYTAQIVGTKSGHNIPSTTAKDGFFMKVTFVMPSEDVDVSFVSTT